MRFHLQDTHGPSAMLTQYTGGMDAALRLRSSSSTCAEGIDAAFIRDGSGVGSGDGVCRSATRNRHEALWHCAHGSRQEWLGHQPAGRLGHQHCFVPAPPPAFQGFEATESLTMAMAMAVPFLHVAHGCRSPCCWRLRPPAPAMGQQPLERRHGLALMPAVAVFTTTLSGRLCITYGDPSYGFTNEATKKENRVFPIFSQKQDGEYSAAQLSAQNRISGSRSFVGTLLEKALVVFVKSQLDDCEDLRVAVGGSNWDLLGGNVRRIEVCATKAIYKGVVISEVGLAACNVRAKLGRKRLFQHPFRVNATIRIREQDFNSSLTSPLMSSSFKDILPRNPQPLRVQYDNGNLRFSSSDKQSGRYGQVEYPITLRVGVENGGEVICVESSKSDSFKKTFKVGPEVKITDFQVGGSWLSLTGEFLLMP